MTFFHFCLPISFSAFPIMSSSKKKVTRHQQCMNQTDMCWFLFLLWYDSQGWQPQKQEMENLVAVVTTEEKEKLSLTHAPSMESAFEREDGELRTSWGLSTDACPQLLWTGWLTVTLSPLGRTKLKFCYCRKNLCLPSAISILLLFLFHSYKWLTL